MDRFDYNFCHSITTFASCSTVGEVLETRDFVASNGKAPLPDFNQGALKRPRYKLERALDRLFDYYARATVPFRTTVLIQDRDVERAMLARGFTRGADVPCMTFAGARCVAPAIPELDVRAARDPLTIADFQRVAFESFGYPVELAGAVLTEELLGLPHVRGFVGYVDGQPAATSLLLMTGDVAGIYWVGTLATHRNQGLGASITAHAVNAGLARGCTAAGLQASPLGQPVYRRIGFELPRAYAPFIHQTL
jgi:GNAT superfamily N-acetyltransferase